VPSARRRRFSNADKRRILEAADRCAKPGEIGTVTRREGVYTKPELLALAPNQV
jgi:hypothetical protein